MEITIWKNEVEETWFKWHILQDRLEKGVFKLVKDATNFFIISGPENDLNKLYKI